MSELGSVVTRVATFVARRVSHDGDHIVAITVWTDVDTIEAALGRTWESPRGLHRAADRGRTEQRRLKRRSDISFRGKPASRVEPCAVVSDDGARAALVAMRPEQTITDSTVIESSAPVGSSATAKPAHG